MNGTFVIIDPAEMKWLIAKKIRNHETEYLRLASASMLGNALNPLTGYI
jgi:hypothetical protein